MGSGDGCHGSARLLRPVVSAADRMRTGARLGVLVVLLAAPGVVATYAYLDGDARARPIVPVLAIGGFLLAAWFAAGRALADPARRRPGGHRPYRDRGRRLRRAGGAGRPRRARRLRPGADHRPLPPGRSRRRDARRPRPSARSSCGSASCTSGRPRLRLRDRAQSIIDESTSVIAEELRLVTDQVGDVRQAADTIDNGISATGTATAAVVDHARRAEEVIASLEQSLRRVADDRRPGPGHRRPDPAARAERHHRGGPGGRARARLHRGRRRGQGAGDHHLELHRADRRDDRRAGTRHRARWPAPSRPWSPASPAWARPRRRCGRSPPTRARWSAGWPTRWASTIDRVEQMSGLAAQLERRAGRPDRRVRARCGCGVAGIAGSGDRADQRQLRRHAGAGGPGTRADRVGDVVGIEPGPGERPGRGARPGSPTPTTATRSACSS